MCINILTVTLLKCFYFFLAKKYKKVTGKEIYSDTLESTPMLEKEKFPQDYFPEVCLGKQRFQKHPKSLIKTIYCVSNQVGVVFEMWNCK